MHTRRLPSTTLAVLAAAVLLTTAGCSSGTGGSGTPQGAPSSASSDRAAGRTDAQTLKPLPAAVPENLKRYYDQKLSWRDCGDEGFQCARMKAPLDYDHPDPSKDLKLAVARKKASGKSKPIGSLLVNPGGPGGSAVDYVQQAAAVGYPPPVRRAYDLVGLDPRGVARSEPVRCLSDKQMDEYTQTDQTPDTKKEESQLVSSYKKFAEGCEKKSGELLGNVSTVDAARDMDVLRALLGDKKLNYVGASYGTYLGAYYAGLYPGRSGRLVLDGAMDPSLSMLRINRDQTGGFETAFREFAKDCVGRTDCPLGRKSPEDAGRKLSAFFKKTDAHPLRTGESRKLTESLATTGVIRAMYDESSWPQLRDALTTAMDGDGSDLLALSDEYFERDPDGRYGNIMFANPSVNCLDLPPAFSSPDAVKKAVPSFEKTSAVFGRGFAWAALNCGYWPEKATGGPRNIDAKGAGPILVVGTTRDPATPYAWAQGLAGQLDSARLLTYEGDGHTAYLRGGACVNDTVDKYLLKGEAPKKNKTCS
ncbi:alpha/beta hydrolase family protein [Streptomyces sp. Amel2xB2]|uniref:alpha/beta hydrolase n=1 Tax=Streptomyces sp. Amel2xB2 TaxID=1305829 RepID=UPI000DBAAE3F|nr:alpha/beta hydrolase [Streptomyces sp. Amel2xB2]RAJ61742.1 alpha/beta hydrolase family protein [Streptomyces sp. Amel2xB2]